MSDNTEDDELIDDVSEEYDELFANSSQAMYIYLDDMHKICNQKFAALLGYDSPEEWEAINENFPTAFVAPKSQERLVATFQRAMEEGAASAVDITWQTKSGGEVPTNVILVPIVFDGQWLALHYITPK